MTGFIVRYSALVFVATLTGCAANDASRVTQAATAPLNDLNLIQAEIPPILIEARKQPYALPAELKCANLSNEIRELDAALGADLDTPATDANPGLIERGTHEAKNAAVGALRNTTEGVVPFRGWVRKLSGAERYSRNVAASIAAGTVRRAYLKGLRASQSCATPTPPATEPIAQPTAQPTAGEIAKSNGSTE